jgi:hypothetical protein
LNGLPEGLKIGLNDLDERFRLSLSSLAVITGIPGKGKSEFCDFICSQFNKLYGFKTAIYSPENQPIGLHIAKIFSKLLSKEFKNAEITPTEFERTLNYFNENFFITEYKKNKTLEQILETAQKLIDSKGIKVLVLDSYNEIEAQKPDGMLDTEWIGKVLDRLAEFSKNNNILLLLVAHTTKMMWDEKKGDFNVPNGYSINGSAHFKGKADYIVVVHKKGMSDETIIKVDKVRYKNYGSAGDVVVDYDRNSGNYFDITYKTDFAYGDMVVKEPYKPEPFVIPTESQNNNPDDYLSIEVDYFNNKADILPKSINLKEFITSEAYKSKVEYIRAGTSEEETKERKNKANLPCVCVSGRFNTHRSISDLKCSTSLICVDIDTNGNEAIMPKVPDILQSLTNVAFYGKSVRGNGYYAIIPIRFGDKLLNHFWALERDFKSLAIKIDAACKDYARLRLASYDTEYWINPNKVDVYNKTLECEYKYPEQKEIKKENKSYNNGNDIETVKNILNDCINHKICLTNNKEEWCKVALSLIDVFKTDIETGREYFHSFAKLCNEYNVIKCNNQFDKLLKKYKDNNKTHVASLIYLYNKHNKE